ncbi:hypothetical protein HDU86_003207 [Geranomyces michiganensis]|nr:hypothetical protein HDU86_003207 [Geranomyces michiganensis]
MAVASHPVVSSPPPSSSPQHLQKDNKFFAIKDSLLATAHALDAVAAQLLGQTQKNFATDRAAVVETMRQKRQKIRAERLAQEEAEREAQSANASESNSNGSSSPPGEEAEADEEEAEEAEEEEDAVVEGATDEEGGEEDEEEEQGGDEEEEEEDVEEEHASDKENEVQKGEQELYPVVDLSDSDVDDDA